MKRMKILLPMLCSAVLFTACGASRVLLEMERSVPAERNIDIEKNRIGLLLDEGGIVSDSLAFVSFTDGMAQAFETRLDLAEESLPIYVGNTSGPASDFSYSFSDLDILFVINQVNGKSVQIQESYIMDDNIVYILVADAELDYDVYNLHTGEKLDSVNGNKSVTWYQECDLSVSPEMLIDELPLTRGDVYRYFGEQVAGLYLGHWKKVDRTLLVFENRTGWVDAYFSAMRFEWDDAMKFWLKQTEVGSREETACAAYNLAVAFEIAEKYDLALQWLDMSDKISKQSCSDRQRMIIEKIRSSALK